MPDISMCTGETCKSKLKCYRFMAIADSHWQSYMAPPHVDADEDSCEYYWSAKGRRLRKEGIPIDGSTKL